MDVGKPAIGPFSQKSGLITTPLSRCTAELSPEKSPLSEWRGDTLSICRGEQLSFSCVPSVKVEVESLDADRRLSEVPLHAMAVQMNQAVENHLAAYPQLLERVQSLGFSGEDLDKALHFVDQEAPVTINFPPVINHGGKSESIFAALTEDGHYQSLWERGSRPRHPKAPKRSKSDFLFKESNTFVGQYNRATPEERPHYGALNFLNAPEGGAAVYGPGVLILKGAVKERTSYQPRDSRFTDMKTVGFSKFMAGCLLSKQDDDLRQLLEVATGRKASGTYGPDNHPQAFRGSNYIEAHIHGEVELSKDLAGVALHRRYRGTATEADARKMADKYQVPLSWYGGNGFVADTDEFILA